ncbi:5-oxoprolinase subunit PxpA [Phytohabitans sp. ZYX-F-186]|uniref:5-oxoprolinase subunit A n=1 Tax=Phytohabitans maris TaxID=3071409 RepID=A0ABU0ZVE8_9ACTN|nr:5-oxoprolinase subunit PxpA [Phytohabitans sp. ZYX-F-186]MDQ7910299.1 5-oxoprolinase subunit PxpA [Phytohabitans sp. ZYX-F-186]
MDLNADLGEGFGAWRLGDDDALLDVVTSANVACGFHAGDPVTMRRVCAAAASKGVAVGAQVGYRDLAGFGRRRIEYAFDELRDDVLYQIGALDAFCRVAGTRVRYVKPHGALYNTAAIDEAQAAAVVAAVVDYDRGLPVLCPPGSVLGQLATGAGLRAVAEGFADRGYLESGALVPRSAPGALVSSPDEVAARAVSMAVDSAVRTVDGTGLHLPVESICVHGDTPGAVALARGVRAALERVGVRLSPFVEVPDLRGL